MGFLQDRHQLTQKEVCGHGYNISYHLPTFTNLRRVASGVGPASFLRRCYEAERCAVSAATSGRLKNSCNALNTCVSFG